MIATTTPIRNPELCVRERLRRKSSSVAGRGFPPVSVRSPLFATSGGGLCVVCSIRLLIAFQILFDAVFRVANGMRQFDFRQVMEIKTLNIAFVSAGHSLLRLHHFEVVGHSCAEAILRLR